MIKSRPEINEELLKRRWFQASDERLQMKLLGLPSAAPSDAPKIEHLRNCDGFVDDMCGRPEEGGGVRHERLIDLLVPNLDTPERPIFGLLANFEVRVLAKDVVYPYQYFSWKQGSDSGTKGVVLIMDKKRLSHVVCLKGFSFAVGAETYDSFGGFGEGLTATDDVTRELKQELNLNLSDATRVVDLGRYHPDRGMSNNMPHLIAAIFDKKSLGDVERFRVNPDIYEMRSGPVVIPVEKLWGVDGFGLRNKDGYFGVCMWRLVCRGDIKPQVVDPGS